MPPAEPPPPAIELRHIDKRFGAVHANRDVSMRIARGSITGIVGESDRDGHFGDVANLCGQIAGHLVDRSGEVLPYPRNALRPAPGRRACHRCRPRAPRTHFRSEDRQSCSNHRIDQLRRAQELAFQRRSRPPPAPSTGREVALGHCANGPGDLRRRPHQIVNERIQRHDLGLAPPEQITPGSDMRCFARRLHSRSPIRYWGSQALLPASPDPETLVRRPRAVQTRTILSPCLPLVTTSI